MPESKRERALRLARTSGLPTTSLLNGDEVVWVDQTNLTEFIERLISLARAEAFEEAAKMICLGFDSGLYLTALRAVEQAAKEERDAN